MKTVAAIISALLTLGQGVIWFVFALIALNGFSEREANPALLALGVVALAAVIASAFVGRGIAARLLARKPDLKGWTVLIAVVLTSMLATVTLFGGLLVAIAVAGVMRR
jgi:hypothetical protein